MRYLSSASCTFRRQASIIDVWTKSTMWLTWIFHPRILIYVVVWHQNASFISLLMSPSIVDTLPLIVCHSVGCPKRTFISLFSFLFSSAFSRIHSFLTFHTVQRRTWNFSLSVSSVSFTFHSRRFSSTSVVFSPSLSSLYSFLAPWWSTLGKATSNWRSHCWKHHCPSLPNAPKKSVSTWVSRGLLIFSNSYLHCIDVKVIP